MTSDLNYRSAVEIMGWEYIQLKSTPYTEFDGDTGQGVEMWYHYNPFYRRPGMGKLSTDTWNPLTDLNQCFMVVEKMIAEGWDFQLSHFDKIYEGNFSAPTGRFLIAGDIEGYGTDTTPGIAILTAALTAKGEITPP